jgi:hypothetical protein
MNTRPRMRQCGLGLFALFGCIEYAAASENSLIGIESRAVVSNGSKQCLIALKSRSDSVGLTKVQVTAFDEGAIRFTVGPIDLAPGRSTVLRQGVDEFVRCSGEGLFYLVSYEYNGMPNEALISGYIASGATPASPVAATAVGGMIGLVSAMAGIGLTHFTTLRRERLKERRDKFNRIEPLFNEFFASWNSSPMPQELQLRFDELHRRTSLEQGIVDQYRHTHRRLADPGIPIDQKREEATGFEQFMRQYLNKLDPHCE